MNKLVCFLIGLWRTLKHLNDFFLDGMTHSGHQYIVMGHTMRDEFGWGDLYCKRCGKISRGNR